MNRKSENLIEKIYSSQYSTRCMLPGPFGKRFITYADYIASGQPLSVIEDFIRKNVMPTYANTHTESSYTGLQTQHYREEARQFIKNSVGATDDDALIFRGPGSTAAIDLMIRKLEGFYADQDVLPVVFIGPYEHHSNILPWREGPFDLIEVPLSSEGNVDLNFLEQELKKYGGTRPIIGSFSAASNVTGVLAPIEKIIGLIKKYDGISMWDFAGAAPYVSIDMNPENGHSMDAIFLSPHKLIGGPGTPGVLVAKKYLLQNGLPVVTGGGTVNFVTKTGQHYIEDVEVREEGGTPAILESIRAGLAFKLKDEVGPENIEKIESDYIERALDKFSKHPNIYVLGDLGQRRLGFMAFHIRYKDMYLHHNFVVALLNDLFGIQSRGGCSCAGPYGHDLLDVSPELSLMHTEELAKGNVGTKPGWARLNFNYFIPESEFNFIVNAMIWIAEHGWKLLNSYHFDDKNALWSYRYSDGMPINSLANFMLDSKELEIGKIEDKPAAQEEYLKTADDVAQKALNEWGSVPQQEYAYDQMNNPLRWYVLVQDIDL